MDESDLTVGALIERAGGVLELSHRYQITTNAIRYWAHRGIPRRYHRDLSSLARVPVETVRQVSGRARRAAPGGAPGRSDAEAG